MATRLMLSLKKSADKSGAFTRTEDLEAINDLVFSRDGGHTTMELAMETGIYRRDDDDDRRDHTTDFELVENRT